MEPILFRYRGRDLCAVDIALVRATIAAYYARAKALYVYPLYRHFREALPLP